MVGNEFDENKERRRTGERYLLRRSDGLLRTDEVVRSVVVKRC